ncbi:hypothetical protein C2845_PM07G02830 [Panicum miliaceum]|uniref:Uncharacterized protein n=1 Tax=Panicum miliaceum TaxID=4540 RepID=A0A3L6SNE0_PANMI|nr:hypothetical protein C2845_PM07G02830 [Panicum miliaceum]
MHDQSPALAPRYLSPQQLEQAARKIATPIGLKTASDPRTPELQPPRPAVAGTTLTRGAAGSALSPTSMPDASMPASGRCLCLRARCRCRHVVDLERPGHTRGGPQPPSQQARGLPAHCSGGDEVERRFGRGRGGGGLDAARVDSMARKKCKGVVDLESSDDSNDGNFEVESGSESEGFVDVSNENDLSYSEDHDGIKRAAYKQVLKDYIETKLLKSLERGMLKEYAEYDLKSNGCYGYYPLLDASRTCYSKHAYSIDSRSQKLVLDLLKLVADSVEEDNTANPNVVSTADEDSPNVQAHDDKSNSHDVDATNDGILGRDNLVYSSQYELQRSNTLCSPTHKSRYRKLNSSQFDTVNSGADACERSGSLPVPNLTHSVSKTSTPNLGHSLVERVMEKLMKKDTASPSSSMKTPYRFVPPPSGYPPNHPSYNSLYKKSVGSRSKDLESRQSSQKSPLSDSTNLVLNKRVKKSVSFGVPDAGSSDVIMLYYDPNYVPDSISPSPRPSISRFSALKSNCDIENVCPGSSQKTPILMQTLDFTPHSSPRITSNTSKGHFTPTSSNKSRDEVP